MSDSDKIKLNIDLGIRNNHKGRLPREENISQNVAVDNPQGEFPVP